MIVTNVDLSDSLKRIRETIRDESDDATTPMVARIACQIMMVAIGREIIRLLEKPDVESKEA